MKTDVAQRLEDSLHNLIRVDLAQEEQRYQVGRRRKEPLIELTPTPTQSSHELIQRKLAISDSNEAWEPISPAEQTYNIFHRSDIGERLLILGEPGAGKTTELLTLSQRLVEEAVQDHDKPIPLIFELSSWTPNTTILAWLGQQLRKSYGVSKKLAAPLSTQWIQQSRILPMLDGLDELGQRNQVACIKALEDFLAQHPALSIIICCRREEYEQGGKQLQQLNGAIYLQSVGPQKIQKYLKALGREQLWQGIQAEPELLKLVQSPLFLTMLVIAYQGQPIRDKSSLFNAYIQKQLYDPNHQGTYKPGKEKSPEQTLHYLGWLAEKLKQRNETEFLIENLQPNWLASKQQETDYELILGTLFIPIVGLIGGLIIGLISGIVGGPIVGLTGGRFGGAFWGATAGPSTGMNGGLINEGNKIVPKEQLKWSLHSGLVKGLSSGLEFGLFGGLSIGLLIGLIVGLSKGLSSGLNIGLNVGLSSGLLIGLVVGLSSGLSSGLIVKAIEQKQVANQGIRNSVQYGLIFGLLFGLLFGLIGGLKDGLLIGLIGGLSSGLLGGLIGGLIGGLEAALQHFSLRICLTRNGYTPWNYAQFLEHAARIRCQPHWALPKFW